MSDGEWKDKRGLYGRVKEIGVNSFPAEYREYLEDHVKNRYSKRTWYNRRATIKHWLVFCIEKDDVDPFAPRPIDIERFIDSQLGAGYSHGTIENRVYDLSSMFRYLSKLGAVPENPVDNDDFELGKVGNSDAFKEIRYIEIDDFKSILDEIESARDALMCRILWDCGVRAQELVSIRIDDVDREKQSINVVTAKQESDTEDRRTVWYTRRTEQLLKQWLDRGQREKYLGSERSPYLFLGKGSDQLNPRRPTEIIREYAESAGVQAELGEPNAAGEQRRSVTAHACRHSYAVHRVRNGMPIVYLAELLGHSDISQTREYLRFRDDDIREADEKYRPR